MFEDTQRRACLHAVSKVCLCTQERAHRTSARSMLYIPGFEQTSPTPNNELANRIPPVCSKILNTISGLDQKENVSQLDWETNQSKLEQQLRNTESLRVCRWIGWAPGQTHHPAFCCSMTQRPHPTPDESAAYLPGSFSVLFSLLQPFGADFANQLG